jgi:hypothetical protein
MASDGKPGGRRKGAANRATAKRQAEIAASDASPLDHMPGIDESARSHGRDEMAKVRPSTHPD